MSQVSPYLRTVLRTAIETLPLLKAYEDVEMPVQQRNAANTARKELMESAWAAADAAKDDIVFDQAETAAEWAAWLAAGGDRTAGYVAWRDSPAKSVTPYELAELGVLLTDARISNPAVVFLAPVTDPDSGAENLKPAVTDLSASGAAASASSVASVHAHAETAAQARAESILEDLDADAPTSDWELWRVRGGDTDPVFLTWLAEHRAGRAFTPPAVPVLPPPTTQTTVGAPTTVPQPPRGGAVRALDFRGALLVHPPAPGDQVTHLVVEWQQGSSGEFLPVPGLSVSLIAYDGSVLSDQLLARNPLTLAYPFNGRWVLRWRNAHGDSPALYVIDRTGYGFGLTQRPVAPRPVWTPQWSAGASSMSTVLRVAAARRLNTTPGAGGVWWWSGCNAVLVELVDGAPQGSGTSKTLFPAVSTPPNTHPPGGGGQRGFSLSPEEAARGNPWRVTLWPIDRHGANWDREIAIFDLDPPPATWRLFS